MIIYKDLISGDEFFSDTYPMTLIHDCVYKVKGKNITLTEQEYDTGANPSAEGDDEGGTDPSSTSGVNIVLANRLVETQFGKKDYQKYIKEFMAKIKTRLEAEEPDEVTKFAKGAQAFMKEMMGEFKEYQFWIGEKMDADGMVALMKWEDETPYMYFFKHAMVAEKV